MLLFFFKAAYGNGPRYRLPWECFIRDVALLSRLIMKDAHIEAGNDRWQSSHHISSSQLFNSLCHMLGFFALFCVAQASMLHTSIEIPFNLLYRVLIIGVNVLVQLMSRLFFKK